MAPRKQNRRPGKEPCFLLGTRKALQATWRPARKPHSAGDVDLGHGTRYGVAADLAGSRSKAGGGNARAMPESSTPTDPRSSESFVKKHPIGKLRCPILGYRRLHSKCHPLKFLGSDACAISQSAFQT